MGSWIGIQGWFLPDAEALARSATPLQRATEPTSTGELVAELVLGFTVCFDIPVSLFVESKRTAVDLAHHIGMFIVAYAAFQPLMNFYVPFFFGVIEVSSIPHCIMDTFHPK